MSAPFTVHIRPNVEGWGTSGRELTVFSCPACMGDVTLAEINSGKVTLFRVMGNSELGYEPWHMSCLGEDPFPA